MLVHIRVTGVLLLLLAALHIGFPRRFHWAEELPRLSLLNRQIFVSHTFFIALLLVLLGILCVAFGKLLLEPSPLGRLVLLGMAIFWSLKLFMQLFVYDRKLWRGNRFNTIAHIYFCLQWAYFVVTYSAAYWLQRE